MPGSCLPVELTTKTGQSFRDKAECSASSLVDTHNADAAILFPFFFAGE